MKKLFQTFGVQTMKFVVLLIILLFSNVNAQREWFHRAATPLVSVASFSVVDSLYIYATDSRGIHRSTDGGFSWITLKTGYWEFDQIIFISRNNGLVLRGPNLMTTTNGGINWYQPLYNYIHSNIYLIDSLNGIAFRTGQEELGFPIYFGRTNNGGYSWFWQETPGSGSLKWIAQVDNIIWGIGATLQYGYPAPVLGTLLRHSTDYGATWSTDSVSSFHTEWSGLVLMRPNAVIASTGRVLKISTNGGTTFVHYLHPRKVYTIQKSGDSVLYAGTDSGYIASSRDYGVTFTYTKLNTNKAIKCIEITNNGDGYAFSDDGKFYSTVKLKMAPVGVDDEEDILPEHFSLSQNYPNPFNRRQLSSFPYPKRDS
ncbi:MAG: hypothetical protein IPJ75_15600 [Ignavibacteriales bacterium]|nr:hypothetical protein [Ignavibacteriales bacterium]